MAAAQTPKSASQNASRTDQQGTPDPTHVCVCPTCGLRHMARRTEGERICAFCGAGFFPERKHAVYCSSRCRKNAWTERKLNATSAIA